MSITFLLVTLFLGAAVAPVGASALSPATRSTVDSLIRVAYARGVDSLAIGERVGRIGRALDGTPYLEGTLEGPGPEVCRITTQGFDCVTFMEFSLDLARIVRRDTTGGRPTADDLRREITRTRYRGGRLAGYASRLHYTSEWIADNVAKGVVEDVTPALGGVPFPLSLGFMSAHPASYPALVADTALVDSMRAIEVRASAIPRTIVPRDRVTGIESQLRTGDLVAIATSIPGLDYSHTGLIYRDADGAAHFLHASSARRRVMLDQRIGEYIARSAKSVTGITVLRPVRDSR